MAFAPAKGVPDAVHRGAHGFPRVEAFGIQLHPASLDLADIENVVNQVQQMQRVLMNMVQEPLLFLVERPFQFLGEQFRETDNCVQRSAKFMAHAGQKFALEPVGAFHFLVAKFELLARGVDFFFGDFSLRDIADDGRYRCNPSSERTGLRLISTGNSDRPSFCAAPSK